MYTILYFRVYIYKRNQIGKLLFVFYFFMAEHSEEQEEQEYAVYDDNHIALGPHKRTGLGFIPRKSINKKPKSMNILSKSQLVSKKFGDFGKNEAKKIEREEFFDEDSKTKTVGQARKSLSENINKNFWKKQKSKKNQKNLIKK